MKKNSLKRVFSALALTAVAVSSVTMSAFAEGSSDELNGLTQAEADASAIQPKITISSEVITVDTAKAEKTRKVTMSVSGANLKYASTGFHVYYSNRLELATNRIGKPSVTAGEAIEFLSAGEPKDDPTADEQGMKGIFVATAGSSDNGTDGVMWTFEFILPDDVKEGDVFPIDIYYKSNENAKDLFTNKPNNATGKAMQAYVFTRGINNGRTSNFDSSTLYTYVAADGTVGETKYSSEDISGKVTETNNDGEEVVVGEWVAASSLCKGIGGVDAGADGVIAVVSTTTPTTTTEETTTTTTEETTTTTEDTTTTTSDATTTTSTSTTTTSTSTTTTTTTTKTGTTTTTKAGTTTAASGGSPITGVAGVGVAVAGLAVALGTAFVLRKKED